MKLERIGRYTQTNKEGYLLSCVDFEANEPQWKSIVEPLKKIYLDKWGDALHSIYLRGSIAKGTPVDYYSDVDSLAIFKQGQHSGFSEKDYPAIEAWEIEQEKVFLAAFPFATGLELTLDTFDAVVTNRGPFAATIKLESVCIYGDDLAEQIAPFKLDSEFALQLRYFHIHLGQFLEAYPNETLEEKKLWLAWIMRRFPRQGIELVMLEEGQTTRDLYLCYESFIKHYPEQKDKMYKALELAINPELNDDVLEFVRDFGGWLEQEGKTKLESWKVLK